MGPTRYQLVVFVCSSISVLMLLSSLYSVNGGAHSVSTGCLRLFQYFSVGVTVESIFRHWSGTLGFKWLFSFTPVFQCRSNTRVYFPSLVGPFRNQLVVFVCSSASVLILLSRLYSVIGGAHSVSTGCLRLFQYFSVDVTVESFFRHWSGPLGILVVFVCSNIPMLLFLSSLFSVIGPAQSGSTGCFRLFKYYNVAVTLESIFRHWSSPLGFNWLF